MRLDQPITLETIARRAGVSKMTVSLALRGHPHASVATRDRLRQLAKEMGYRPNPLIAASMAQLRLGRRSHYAGTLAFAGMGPSPAQSSADTFERRVFVAAQERADALGYPVQYFALDDRELDGRRLSEIFVARGIAGVILAANGTLPPNRHLDWSQFALAAVERTEVGRELHRTAGDSYRAMCEICDICRFRGYRRIGLAISTEHDVAPRSLHRSAFLGCQAQWPRRDHVPAFVAGQWTQAPFLEWVRHFRPEVIIANSDAPVSWLEAQGLRIPEDIGFIRPHANRAIPAISGFLFDDAELGSTAVDLVVEQLNHNERGLPKTVKHVLLQGQWSEGRSLRPGQLAPQPVN